MRLLIPFVLAFLALASAAKAEVSFSNYNVDISLSENMASSRTISADFVVSGEPANSVTVYSDGIVKSAKACMDYELPVTIDQGKPAAITAYFGRFLPPGSYKIRMEILEGGTIFRSGNLYNFLFGFTAPGDIENLGISVALPGGMALDGGASVLYPAGKISTDGERIIATWKDSKIEAGEKWLFKAAYLPAQAQDSSLLVYAAVGLAVLAAVLAAAVIYMRKKNSTAFVEGLGHSEKAVIEFLLKHGQTKQNVAQKQLGFSKARMSRAVSSLNSKGLLKKRKAGKTNRLEIDR
jgi:hypothetical protein